MMRLNIKRQYLHYFEFTDDILIISESLDDKNAKCPEQVKYECRFKNEGKLNKNNNHIYFFKQEHKYGR